MRLVFLGGAESIGASSALLEIDDRRWVVDCGVRIRGSGAERLPDLAYLEKGGAPTAVLITHAHLDHIGALPVLHQRYPLVPIYATAPTIALTRIQLLDSLRIMEEEAGVEGELPLYSATSVESLLGRMIPVTPLRPICPDAGGPEVTFFPAGHILGACSLGISAREGRLFLSGDVSVDNQRTIPGMHAPRFRADVAVFESTYGNRLHPKRSIEEERLVETVAGTIAQGGKVLIPAFAIGRAQEVILILLRAQLLKQVPRFPIHVDGMVRRACAIYADFPWFLQSTLRRRIEKHGDPFFGVLDNVRPVRGRAERAEILAGPPAVIVASSGMLAGGPSPYYAAALAGDPKNLIGITGYQDEEAPGRRILDAAEGRSETVVLEGREVRPRARIAAYALSGHAGGSQIAALARALEPADVFLVHGEAGARQDLAQLFLRERIGRVHLPSHGDPVVPLGRRKPSALKPADDALSSRRLHATGIGGSRGTPMTEKDVSGLADHLLENYSPGAAFTARDLYVVWQGVAPGEEEAARFEEVLRASSRFEPHPTRLFQFVPVSEAGRSEETSGTADANALAARIDRALPPGAGLLRKSYQPGVLHMTLVFPFPETAKRLYAPILDDVFKESGWTFELHPVPNIASLESVIRARLPDPMLVTRNVSARMEERSATVSLARVLWPEEEPSWAAAAAAIREETGFRVEFVAPTGTARAKKERDPGGRLEINLAYQAIRAEFEGEKHRPYRVGKKSSPRGEPYIEVAFVSPEVGERYREKLQKLGAEIAWPLELAGVPNQSAILASARDLLRGEAIKKGPSFVPARRKVTVTIGSALSSEEKARLAVDFQELTGYSLDLAVEK